MKKKFDFIYNFYERAGIAIVKYRWIALISLVAITFIAIMGLTNTDIDISTDDWFKEGEMILEDHKEFEKKFGNNEYVAFFIESEDVFSYKTLSMMRKLSNDLLSEVEFAEEILSIAETDVYLNIDGEIVNQQLVPDPLPSNISDYEKIRSLAMSKPELFNIIISSDSKQTWLILKLKPFPEEEDSDTLAQDRVGLKILEILSRPEYRDYSIKANGAVIMSIEEMEYIQTVTPRLVSIAMIVSLVVLALFLRSFRGVIIPIISTILTLIIVFGFMGHLQVKLVAVLLSLPVFLTLVISIGYSIHLFNIFKRNFISTGNRKKSVILAVRETGWPIFFTAMTTIAALLSFCFIPLLPLKWLGAVSAALIFTTYLIVMVLTPALLSFGKDKAASGRVSEKRVLWSDRYLRKLGGIVNRKSKLIMTIFIIVILIFSWGITKAEIGSDLKRTYGEKIPFVSRIIQISESEIGYFYSYNITLDFNKADSVINPEILKNLEIYADDIGSRNHVRKVISSLPLFKEMNKLLNNNNSTFYSIPETVDELESIISIYESESSTSINTWISDDYSTLRLEVAIDAISDKAMRQDISFIEERANQLFPDAKLAITGMMPTMVAINTNITQGLITSLIIALAVICVLLMIVFKSVKTGLIGMIPNITPVIIVGGAMGLLNIPLDFLTMTMLPMILGLAVDDTIHFVNHAYIEFQNCRNYEETIKRTLSVTGRALFMTSFIIISAFGIYFTADMKAQVNFGIFITLGISSALIADYFITPVCMKWFKPFGKESS